MADGSISIAVISDTHGFLRRSVVRELSDCSVILHAGDIINRSDLDELALYGSLYAVKGNCDVWIPGLEELAGVLSFTVGGVRFVMTHDEMNLPKDREPADVVVTGHTHRYREARDGGVLRLNPGSCGRSRFGSDVTMAKLTVKDGKILRVRRIDFRDEDP